MSLKQIEQWLLIKHFFMDRRQQLSFPLKLSENL